MRIDAGVPPDIASVIAIGTIQGIAPLEVSGLAPDGLGAIRSLGDGLEVAWRAPGSTRFGDAVRCAADGDYLLEDGDDRNAWLRLRARSAFMGGPGKEATVFCRGPYNRLLIDFTSSQAFFGGQFIRLARLRNESPIDLSRVKLWCPSAGVELALGGPYSTAATEETALDVGTIPAGGVQDFQMRFTLAPGTDADPRVLLDLRTRWDSF